MSTRSEPTQAATLSELLASPSPESWAAIVEMGKFVRKGLKQPDESHGWIIFTVAVIHAVKSWPPEIERLCPPGWPREFRETVEHRVLETDTYGHYVAKICGDPALRLSDGSQAVWLERRFTGGIVPVSIVQQATRLISAMLQNTDDQRRVVTSQEHVQKIRNLLANGVRNVGKVGCADLTGGLVVECRQCACGIQWSGNGACPNGECERDTVTDARHEYRLEVEIKVGKQPQDPAQVLRMNHVRSRGGCYVLTHSVDEAVAGIVQFRDSKS